MSFGHLNVNEFCETLRRVVPRANQVNVKWSRNKNGEFVSMLEMQIKGKVFRARKKAQSLSNSLSKCKRAALRQVEKSGALRARQYSKTFYSQEV